jgi:asparagine synthase (glutamine-hydrolysing)
VADARLQGRAALARSLGFELTAQVTDAQLIAHAWLRHGEDCVAHIDGDFAYSVWDPRSQALSCARDPMGSRPLYVHHSPGRLFAFASSTPAMLALPGVPDTVDEARIGDFLIGHLEGIDHRATFHQQIERLPPAHQRTLRGARQDERRYWRLGTDPLPGMPRSNAAWAEALHATMEAVVADHLAGGLPTGSMLSGGLDSSSLAVIAADQLRRAGRGPLPTFSSVDTRSDNPETRAITAMLALPGFDPHLTDHVLSGPVADRLWQQMWQVEEPWDGSMVVLYAQYLSAADAGVAAVLDGVDGDNLFLIGNGQARLLRRGRFVHAWRNAQGLATLIDAGVPPSHYFKRALRRAAVPDRLRRLHRRRRGATPADTGPDTLVAADFAARIDLPGRLQRMQTWRSSMPLWNRFEDAREPLEHPYISIGLERYRRGAASQGIDPLHPFTDRRLLVLCSQMPDHLRMGHGLTKHLLRRIMQRRLPEPVRLRRDKKHLGWVHNQALLEHRRGELCERMTGCRAAIAPYVAPSRLDRIVRGLADFGSPMAPREWLEVFELVQLGTWLSSRQDPTDNKRHKLTLSRIT